uniref:N-acetyltransferase domain-containing protein n=1 Tax=Dracunculus medinensis TaxID=318479 RepID=A0A0N4UP08_DRAME
LYFAGCTEDDLSDFFEDLRDDGGTGSNHSFVMYDKDSTLIAICLNSIDEIGAKDGQHFRRGLGTQLIELAIEEAVENDCAFIVSATTAVASQN